MIVRKPTAVLVLMALMCALCAAPAGASVTGHRADVVSPMSTTHHSLSAARAYVVGKWTSGPSSYTKWQRVQLTGSHKDPCFDFYDIDDVMHQYVDPRATNTTVHRVAGQVAPSGCPVDRAGAAGSLMLPLSWYNPFSWDWGHIMSAAWNAIWNNCLSGAVQGVVGTAAGTTIVNLLARGGKLFVGPYGYAAIAIGGCAASISW